MKKISKNRRRYLIKRRAYVTVYPTLEPGHANRGLAGAVDSGPGKRVGTLPNASEHLEESHSSTLQKGPVFTDNYQMKIQRQRKG